MPTVNRISALSMHLRLTALGLALLACTVRGQLATCDASAAPDAAPASAPANPMPMGTAAPLAFQPMRLGRPPPEVAKRAALIEQAMCSRWNRFASLTRLSDDFAFWQRLFIPIAPPDPDRRFYAQHNAMRVFDPTGFPARVLAGLIPELYRNRAIVYRVTVCEHAETRERLFLNANGQVIWRVPPTPGYDPWEWLRRIGALEAARPGFTEQRLVQLRRLYDPSRIVCEYLLLPRTSLADYALSSAYESVALAAERDADRSLSAMLLEPVFVTEPTVSAIAVDTNAVRLSISLPEAFASPLGLFSRATLSSGRWTCAGSTNAAGAFDWNVPRGVGEDAHFYTIADLGPDTDGDGLPDAMESLVYGTDPTKLDTDGDSLPDAWELNHGLNPLNAADFSGNPSGDGYSNLTKFLLGADPLKFDTAVPEASLQFRVTSPLKQEGLP